MISVTASVKPRDAFELGVFRKLNVFCRDLRPAFRQLRKPVLADQRDHRKAKSGPKGRWPELAASTKARYKAMRKSGRKPPRSILGRLPSALLVTMDRMKMRVTSRVKWSLVHKKGGRAGRAKIPPRDFLWISGRLRRQVLRVMLSSWKARR